MRSSKRTGMPLRLASWTISSRRPPWRPRTTSRFCRGFPASSASRTALGPVSLSMGSVEQSSDGLGRDGFPAANCVDSFICFCFEIDAERLDFQGTGKRVAHGRKVRTEFRLFGNHNSVNVADVQAAGGDQVLDAL